MGSTCSNCNTPMAYVPDSKGYSTKTVLTRDGQVRVYTTKSRRNSEIIHAQNPDVIDRSLMFRKNN